MPESPLGPTAARQTPASSLLSRAGNGAAERVANGESCSGVRGENWQSLHHKQVAPSAACSSSSPHLLLLLLLFISGKENSLRQTDVKRNTTSQLHIGRPLTGQQTQRSG